MAKMQKHKRGAAMSPEKVAEVTRTISKPSLRSWAMAQYKKWQKLGQRRHGSDLNNRQVMAKMKKQPAKRRFLEQFLVTREDRRKAALLYANSPKSSYAYIEEPMGLRPVNGMDAYRVIQQAIEEDKTGKLAKEVQAGCKKFGKSVPKACRRAIAEAHLAKA